MIALPPPAARVLGALLLTSALASTIFWLRLPAGRPTDAELSRLAEVVAAERAPGEPLFAAPHWAQRPRAFVDGLSDLDPAALTELELAGLPGLFVIALPDAPRSDALGTLARLEALPGLVAGPTRRFGPLMLRHFRNEAPPPALRLTEALARVEGATDDGPCRFDGEALRCPGGPWMTFAPAEHEVERQGRRCLFLHPPREGALRLQLPATPEGRVLGGIGFASSEIAAWAPGATVTLELVRDGAVRARVELRAGDERFRRFSLPAAAGAGPVTLRLSADADARRHLCAELVAW